MSYVIVTLAFFGVWVLSVASVIKKNQQNQTRAHDGHLIQKENDITCDIKNGHTHKKPTAKEIADYGRRFIVHEDPPEGYVILNGVKRKISECKNL